jgi:predicted HAD superfamily Cof-like phosphohydrolase
MQTPDSLNSVAQFHKTFQHPVVAEPQIPSTDRCKLRVSLIAEELSELVDAIKTNDLVEVADALCDIQYVLAGAILEFGLGEKFNELFNEVQRSNMSKACDTEADAKATVDYYTKERDTPCYYEEKEGKFLVYRTEDRKTLKSVSYSPANIALILKQ